MSHAGGYNRIEKASQNLSIMSSQWGRDLTLKVVSPWSLVVNWILYQTQNPSEQWSITCSEQWFSFHSFAKSSTNTCLNSYCKAKINCMANFGEMESILTFCTSSTPSYRFHTYSHVFYIFLSFLLSST